jgi:hypothetical protein
MRRSCVYFVTVESLRAQTVNLLPGTSLLRRHDHRPRGRSTCSSNIILVNGSGGAEFSGACDSARCAPRSGHQICHMFHATTIHNCQRACAMRMHMSIHMCTSSRSSGKRIRRKGKCVHVNLDNTTIARHHDNYPAIRM